MKSLTDIAYVSGGARQQKLDIFQPMVESGPLATILMLHGGSGKRGDMYQAAIHFVNQGFQVILIGFRDYPDYFYPDPVEDVFCAVAWMGETSDEFGFQMDRLIGLGHSFGGTLVSSLAVVKEPELYLQGCEQSWPEETRFIAVVPFTGIFNYEKAAAKNTGLLDYVNAYLGNRIGEIPEDWSQASPSSWVNGQEPPFLLIHGQDDTNIPPSFSKEFADLLTENGVTVQLDLIEGMDHNGITKSEEIYSLVDEFLSSILGELP